MHETGRVDDTDRVPPKVWAPRLAGSVAVLGLATALARTGVPSGEESVFRTLYRLPDQLDPVLWTPMQLGSAVAPFLVAAGAFLVWRQWRPAVGAVVVGMTGWWLAKVVKDVVGRGRPYSFFTDLPHRSGVPSDLGFPSGHATVAFGLAAVLSPYLGRTPRAVVYGLAVVVAFARIHVGAHLPLDVIGGAALGYALGWTWHLAVGISRTPT